MADSSISGVVTATSHSSISPNDSHRPVRADSLPWIEIALQESNMIADGPVTLSLSSSRPPSEVVTKPHATTEEDGECDGNADTGLDDNVGKRPAWNKPSKGSTEFGGVMGAHAWPALSETARIPSRSSSDSLRGSFDGSSASPSEVSASQERGSVSSSSTPRKPVSNRVNANSNFTQNHIGPGHQRPMRRNSDNTASNGGLSQPPPQGHVHGSFVNNASSRDHTQRSGFVSQSQIGGNDHPHPRNSFRHRNGGLYPRGDGSHHQNFGGRRNQDHGNHEWNGRNFNSRGGHIQPRGAPRFMRPPPPPHELTSLYVVPPPPESFRGMPYVAPMAPVFFPAPEHHYSQLHTRIMNQIDYYFSNENLIKDTYLRQHMDEQGWVPINLIAGFRKVSQLTDNIQLITDALQGSAVVEVKNNKVRKRIDWMRWILPSSVQFHNMTGRGARVTHVENTSTEQRTANHTEGTSAGAQGDPASDSN